MNDEKKLSKKDYEETAKELTSEKVNVATRQTVEFVKEARETEKDSEKTL